MKDWFIEGFEYDAWANRRWMDALNKVDPDILNDDALKLIEHTGVWPDFTMGDPRVRAREVFVHILWAQKIWVERCGVKVQPTEVGLAGWIDALPSEWLSLFSSRSEDEMVSFRNQSGDPFVKRLGEMARQVLTHGTYHRGQLREVVGSFAPDSIVGTDILLFYIERDKG